MRLIKRQFYVINKFIIKVIGEGIIKLFISNDKIVRIEKIIYVQGNARAKSQIRDIYNNTLLLCGHKALYTMVLSLIR